jgi:hypothetical protein
VAHKLMVLLNYLGTEGGGTSSPTLQHDFGIGKGTNKVYNLRVPGRARQKVVRLYNMLQLKDTDGRSFIPLEIHLLSGTTSESIHTTVDKGGRVHSTSQVVHSKS